MASAPCAVVLAGGSGERFWPVSTVSRPKQLLNLSHPDKSMLEEAIERVEPLVGARTYVATTPALADILRTLELLPSERIFVEPDKRNTLGALVWAVANLAAHGAETPVAILTADHAIADPAVFRENVADALGLAQSVGGIVTLGIQPTRPETGYGYIEYDRAHPLALGDREVGFRALRFREKPSLELAVEFLASGNFAWNSGMFFFTVGEFRRELGDADPALGETFDAIAERLQAGDTEGAAAAFRRLPNLSIDYALLERAKVVSTIPARFGWDDLGAWDALERSLPLDELGNVFQGEVLAIDCEGTIGYNENPGMRVCLLGLEELVVVVAEHAVLVCPKSRAQEVKRVVDELRHRHG